MMTRWVAVRPRMADVLFAALLLGFTLLLWLPRFDGPIDLRYDAGVYYLLGTSLAEGNGYRLLNEPGEIEAIQYPPLLPALVAAHQWVLGTDDHKVVGHAFRYTFFLFSVLYVVGAYAMARRFVTATYAFLVGLMICFYLFTYFLSDLLFAEIPFCVTTTFFVLCYGRGQRRGEVAVAAVLGGASYLLRTTGVALLMAWVGASVLDRRWRRVALIATLSLVPVVAWQGYILRVTSGKEYADPAYEYQRAPYQYWNVSYAENVLLVDPFIPELGRASTLELGARFLRNLAAMPLSLGEGVSSGLGYWEWALIDAQQALGTGWPSRAAVRVPLTLLGCLVLGGLVLMLARREWLVPLYVFVSVALVSLTPWPNQFTRYMTPMTPFLALALIRLLAAAREWALRRDSRWQPLLVGMLTGGVVSAILGMQAYTAVKTFTLSHKETYNAPGHATGHRLFFYDDAWISFDRAVAWLKDGVKSDVVATVAPHLVYLKTGAKAILPPMEVDPAEAQRLLDSVPVSYLIADELTFVDTTQRYVRPVIEANPGRWDLIYRVPGTETRIYHRADPGGAGAAKKIGSPGR